MMAQQIAFQRICVVGAGAVGSFLGGLLQRSLDERGIPATVSLVARGEHAAVMQRAGVTVSGNLSTLALPFTVRPQCVTDISALPPQDLVLVTVKGPALRQAAEDLQPLMHDNTVVLPVMNGLPFWYFYGQALIGPDGQRVERLASVDPEGRIAQLLPPERVVGAVIHVPAEVVAPGNVRVLNDARLLLGEPLTAEQTPRLSSLMSLFEPTGLHVKHVNIRHEVWSKLLVNTPLAPVSVITGGTYEEMIRHAPTRDVLMAIGREVEQVAAGCGVPLAPLTIEGVLDRVLANIGGHRSSMLQDTQRGRSLELNSIVQAVAEVGELVGVNCATIRTVYALAQLKDRLVNSR